MVTVPSYRARTSALAANDLWVRFHSLPDSRRYAENEAEYAELLHRHNVVLNELRRTVGATTEAFMAVSTSWSMTSAPVAREPDLEVLVPDAAFWLSILRERDGDDEYWIHLHLNTIQWSVGVLNPLLGHVADDQTRDIIMSDRELHWLYHPYDGGADVIVRSQEERNVLREEQGDWLSTHKLGL